MTDDLLARHRAVMPGWMPIYYGDDALEIVGGSGRRVTGADGRGYLDFFGGVLTTMIGYDVPEINEAVRRQLSTGVVHTSTLYLIRQQVELAEKIARVSGIPDARVFFTNSGSEANELAILAAREFTGRDAQRVHDLHEHVGETAVVVADHLLAGCRIPFGE